MKPQLADDADIDSIIYPCIFQPKVDGVRAMNLKGTLTGRSLDPFTGFGLTEFFSKPEYLGLDGELIVGNNASSQDRLCSLTSGAVSKFKGVTQMADFHWYVFDYLTPDTIELPYAQRYAALVDYVQSVKLERVVLMPSYDCADRATLDSLLSNAFTIGFEGGIVRNPCAPLKQGRPSKKLQELVRFKPWADAEILVTGITEGEENHNEATVNTLGRTERSSSQDGKVPNGMVGSIQGTLLADFYDPVTKKLLFAKGLAITISKGCLTQAEAKHYWEHPEEIVGHIAKFKTMVHGVKDLPRFPGYLSHRSKQDMS